MSIGYRAIALPVRTRRARFVSLPAVGAIASVGLLALGLLHRDRDALVLDALENASSDAVAEQYIVNLLRARPEDKDLRMKLAEQRLGHGQFIAVLSTLQPLLQDDDPEWRFKAAYLGVQALDSARRAARPASAERAALEAKFRTQLALLAFREGDPKLLDGGSPAQIERLLEDARMLGDTTLMEEFAARLAALAPQQGAAEYVSLAQVALGRGDYLQSARFYWQARRLESDRSQQRAWYLESLRALQSGNLLAERLTDAEREMGDLVNDAEVLYTFITLARAADRPDIAARYARQLMLTAG